MVLMQFLVLLLLALTTIKGTHTANFMKAKKRQFPFFAQIQLNEKPICSGSLISPRWLLSAGHCFSYTNVEIDNLLDGANITVVMGTNRFDSLDQDKSYVRKDVLTIVIHDDYHECYNNNKHLVTRKYDIALLMVDSPFSLNRLIQVVKITKRTQMCKEPTVITTRGNHAEVLYATTEMYYPRSELIPEWFRSSTVIFSTADWYRKRRPPSVSGGSLICYSDGNPVLYGVLTGVLNFTESSSITFMAAYESVKRHVAFIKKHVSDVQVI